MLRLTRSAVTQLRVKRLLPAKLVLNLAAMAIGLVSDFEVGFLVHAVRRALLPLAVALGALIDGVLVLGLVGIHEGGGAAEEGFLGGRGEGEAWSVVRSGCGERSCDNAVDPGSEDTN